MQHQLVVDIEPARECGHAMEQRLHACLDDALAHAACRRRG